MTKPRAHASEHEAEVSDEWAWVELNYRPHAYQAGPVRWAKLIVPSESSARQDNRLGATILNQGCRYHYCYPSPEPLLMSQPNLP